MKRPRVTALRRQLDRADQLLEARARRIVELERQLARALDSLQQVAESGGEDSSHLVAKAGAV